MFFWIFWAPLWTYADRNGFKSSSKFCGWKETKNIWLYHLYSPALSHCKSSLNGTFFEGLLDIQLGAGPLPGCQWRTKVYRNPVLNMYCHKIKFWCWLLLEWGDHTQDIHLLSVYYSGQIIMFHQPRFPWNKGMCLTKPPFGVRSCEVAIIWQDYLLGWFTLKSKTQHFPLDIQCHLHEKKIFTPQTVYLKHRTSGGIFGCLGVYVGRHFCVGLIFS